MLRRSYSRSSPSVEQQKSVAEPFAGVDTDTRNPEIASLLTRSSEAIFPERTSKRRTHPSAHPIPQAGTPDS